MSEYGARSVNDFCKSVGIGRTSFYKEVKEGRLKVVKVGDRSLVRDDDGRAWLDNLPLVGRTNLASVPIHRASGGTGRARSAVR